MPAGTGPTDLAVAKLVEQQMRNWELARSQRTPEEVEDRPEVADFVCISRDVGTGAKQIGVLLGERLGWPVLDKEILHAMARDDAIREQIYASMDERDIGWCEEVLRAFTQPEFVKNDYFHQLTKTLLSLARQGSAVFIGRGADMVLPHDTGLRVRIVAPLAARTQRVAQQRGISEEEARKEIQRLEAERAGYIHKHFHVDTHNPERFDMVINLARISTSQAVDIIESARDVLGFTAQR